MTSLLSLMRRRLAIVDNDGNGTTGDKVNNMVAAQRATVSTMMVKA